MIRSCLLCGTLDAHKLCIYCRGILLQDHTMSESDFDSYEDFLEKIDDPVPQAQQDFLDQNGN